MKTKPQIIVASVVLLILSLVGGLFAVEGVLRLKNASMKNYDIEMWRYAKLLKFASEDPELGHEHVPSATAKLQSVEIRTNKFGLRGPEVAPKEAGRRDILVLGSSIALGWGVPEDQTMAAVIEKGLKARGENVTVMNGGIGNYNAPRYVKRFLTRLTKTKPDDILVHAFLRDAEPLSTGGGNWFLKNSQLAVTLWNVGNRLFKKTGEHVLEDHYKGIYAGGAPGITAMDGALGELSKYASEHHIRLYLAMTPDVHNLKNYPFGFAHEAVKQIATKYGYRYIDLYPAMSGLTPEEVWSMPGDPHPNALGHRLMAEAVLPELALEKNAPPTQLTKRP